MGNPGKNRARDLLALQRMGFLRPAEKLKTLSALDDGVDLSVLSLSELEFLVGRRLRPRRWNLPALLAAAEEDLEGLPRLGVRYVHLEDREYPPLLREIHDPPFGLFVRGVLPAPELPGLAVVGTREPSLLGFSTALELARAVSRTGLPVISGLARGIDGAAHRAALDARDGRGGGYTLAVLPRGIDAVYPCGNRALAAAILDAGGALVSEYPPGTELALHHFPERNRIIAGLARGVLVIEAPARSGALITAEYGLEEGREVFVAAALLGGPKSAGIDRLAEEGAETLAGVEELLSAWGLAGRESPLRDGGPREPGSEAGRLARALRAELGLGEAAAS